MFVSKINGVSNLGFKGYQHVKNDVGETVLQFNYPYDYDTQNCKIQFFRAIPTENHNYRIIETPIATEEMKPEGINVNLQDKTNLDQDDAFAYKVIVTDKATGKTVYEGPDTGVSVKRNPKPNAPSDEFVFRVSEYDNAKYDYTLVSRKGTTPRSYGAGYLIAVDSFMPGVKRRGFNEKNTGEIYYDAETQKKMENIPKTFSNVYGGNLAGIEFMLQDIKNKGVSRVFLTPIANGSGPWSLGYWNKNNMQVSPNMGNTEDFNSLFRELYKKGMTGVFDGTFTSEGLEGIHYQYALRWAEKNPQTYYWFRMSGMKNAPIGFGVMPVNQENARFKVINGRNNYELQSDGTYKKVPNPNYKENSETYIQIYDASQASERQAKDYENAIKNYENLSKGREIDINSHDDTLINFVFQADNNQIDSRIDVINDLNKNHNRNIKLDSPEGVLMVGHFSNYRFDKKTEGGNVTWDANTDMIKMNYGISGYDTKILKAIADKDRRYQEQQRIELGTREVRDMALQAGRYWTKVVKDAQTFYSARVIGNAKTTDAVNKLIEEGKLPESARVNDNIVNNILNGAYLLEPKGILDKDSVTVKSLMELPLDSLEFGENTVGVLSTSYFSNRATTEETIGKTRFELMRDENPHLIEPYADTYNKVNAIFEGQLKDFADVVINKVNETSNEKLLDSNGNYTEYGEYVMELIGKDIAKYAMLKSLSGDSFKAKVLDGENNRGEITYDYENIKQATSLMGLGINAHNPEEEAKILERKIEQGLATLNDDDINFVADAISKRIKGTDTASFRFAEALVDRSAKGLDWRLDAAKDVMDMDAVRNEDESFDDSWNTLIDFWSKFVQVVKSQNPSSYIVAEITNVCDLMRDNYGNTPYVSGEHPYKDSPWPYDGNTDIGQTFNGEPDAMVKFFNETGITTEAAYSYFFTSIAKVFSPNFETGVDISENHDDFKGRLEYLLKTRSADYLRNLYTFLGNHDKPRMVHCLAIDMGLFQANLLNDNNNFQANRAQRLKVIKVLSGANNTKDIPIELRLNVDNNNYFRAVSQRGAAMSKLIMESAYEDLDGIASENDKKRIADALIDLANGNYLGVGSTDSMTKINIKELSSLENAFGAILDMAAKHGLKLTDSERKALIEKVVEQANSKDLSNYLVQYNQDGEPVGSYKSHAANILGVGANYNNASPYVIQLAKLLKDSYKESGMSALNEVSIFAGIRDFAEKYNKKTVDSATGEFKSHVDYVTAMRRNGYAARDIKLAIKMAIKQAEFKSKTPIENKEKIVETIYKSVTEAADHKAAMIHTFFSGLFGSSTMYAGDEYGMSGYEEKAKNIYLQNRNVMPYTQKSQKQDVLNLLNSSFEVRKNQEAHALNDGTPYALEVQAHSVARNDLDNEINKLNKAIDKLPAGSAERKNLEIERRKLIKDKAKIAYLMQSSNGDMTISLFNAGEVEHGNRVDYWAKYADKEKYPEFAGYDFSTEEGRKKFYEDNNIESINPNNKYIPIQPKSELDAILLTAGIALPLGTIFTNANTADKAEYVVQKIGEKLGIVKKGGGKIIMDGKTAKNGVMVLKKIGFRGKKHNTFFNSKYNFVSSPYKIAEPIEEGKNLSVISR